MRLGWPKAPIMGSFAKLNQPFMHDNDRDNLDYVDYRLLEGYNLGRKKKYEKVKYVISNDVPA